MEQAQPLIRTYPRVTRIKRALVGMALAAFLSATLIAGLGGARSAYAATLIEEWHNGDYSYVQLWQQDDGSYFFWGVEADGEEWVYVPEGNPNPEDPSSNDTPLTPEAVMEMLKKYSGGMTMPEEEFWGGMLGKIFSEKGEGLIPVWNPPDIAKTYEDFGGAGGGGFDPNGGDILEQLKNRGTPPTENPNDDEERDDYGTEEHKDGMYDDVMVGPPELINPNPTSTTERLAMETVAP